MMQKRMFLSVILGWLGLFFICLLVLAPIVFMSLDGTVLPYGNVIPLVAAIITIGASMGLLFFIPITLLITMTLKVFDDDDLS